MADLLSTWDATFAVQLFRDHIVPVFAGGFMLGGVFWLVGYLVDFLFSVLRGGFFWTR